MSKENEWEELDKLLDYLHSAGFRDDISEKYGARIKNYVQKERILAKIKENHQWVNYLQS
jgi:hypothetical protein